MASGMADFAHKAATSGEIYLEKIEDWDFYSHYAAGLTGEGLSSLCCFGGGTTLARGSTPVKSFTIGDNQRRLRTTLPTRDDS